MVTRGAAACTVAALSGNFLRPAMTNRYPGLSRRSGGAHPG